MLNPNWNYDGDLHKVLIACVGLNFGPEPETKLEEIRANRAGAGDRVRHMLNLGGNDVVADIGSGCGFVTRAIVPFVKEMHCIDVSKDFLDYTRAELGEFSNVRYHQINYADFPDIPDQTLTAAYSTAVFIHFNYYDMVLYLREINRAMKQGSRLLFDFLNADRMDIAAQKSFSSHVANYKSTREQKVFNVVHPFSMRALEHLLPQCGFTLERVDYLPANANTTVVARKK